MKFTFPKNQGTILTTAIPVRVRTLTRTPHSTAAPRKPRTLDANCLAHDARNWLTVLQVYCDLLRTSGAPASDYEKWVEELSGAVERGQGLVVSLLDTVEKAVPAPDQGSDQRSDQRNAARKALHPTGTPDSGCADSEPSDRRWPAASVAATAISTIVEIAEPLDVAAAVARRLPLLQRLAGGNIQVEIDAPANAGKVALAESAFERILHNLVGNAIEAMPRGGHLRIVLRRGNRGGGNGRGTRPAEGSRRAASLTTLKPAKSAGKSTPGDRRASGASPGGASKNPASKTLLLRIHDTGDGIAPERLSRIFEAGVSGKAGQESDRHRGLGLAIVRELTRNAGGAVRVRSRPGHGACFEIELPRI